MIQAQRACPSCRRRVADDHVLCVNCGYDFRAARRLASISGDAAARIRGAIGVSSRVWCWCAGLAAATAIVVSFVGTVTGRFTLSSFLTLALCYVGAGLVTGMYMDYRRRGLLAALMWLVPFASSAALTTVAVGHEVVSPRAADRSAVRQAIYANALLAGVLLLVPSVKLLFTIFIR